LADLTPVLERRVVLVTGKGGVGRTTVAAALALVAERQGRRVLVCDVLDAAERYSALARHFGRDKFEPEAVVQGRIHGCHLHPRTGHENFLRSTLPGGTLVSAALRSRALQRFLNAAPSFHEMGIFNHFLSLIEKKGPGGAPYYDQLIVDMPATGHTLALTGLPDLLLRLMPRGPIARLVRRGQAVLNDPAQTAAWVVTLPETLPITESLELIEGLRETRMHVGGVILNRLPEDPFSAAEREALSQLLDVHPVYGQLAFDRIRESSDARSRLRSALDVPLVVLKDMAEEGRELVRALAREPQEAAGAS